MAEIAPSAQLTLTKGNKSWSSTAEAAALEIVDPWLDLGCHSQRPSVFIFFFLCPGLSSTRWLSHNALEISNRGFVRGGPCGGPTGSRHDRRRRLKIVMSRKSGDHHGISRSSSQLMNVPESFMPALRTS
eukprot:FR737569.1.p1 GENE.FR737569.1~~FR737569.1.p1  ORF type:complete len:130 (-),score=13.88 FR737569.1:171-560(-)